MSTQHILKTWPNGTRDILSLDNDGIARFYTVALGTLLENTKTPAFQLDSDGLNRLRAVLTTGPHDIDGTQATTPHSEEGLDYNLPSWCGNKSHSHRPHIDNGTCGPAEPLTLAKVTPMMHWPPSIAEGNRPPTPPDTSRDEGEPSQADWQRHYDDIRPGETCRGVPGSPGYVNRGEWWVTCKGCTDCTTAGPTGTK